MGKRHREYDISGMKLFGRCKAHGNCICGNCANAPINQRDAVKVTHADGRTETMAAPAIAADYDGVDKTPGHLFNQPINQTMSQSDKFRSRIAHGQLKPDPRIATELPKPTTVEAVPKVKKMPAFDQQNRKRCPDCNVALTSRHKCKAGTGKNGPVEVTLPGGEPVSESKPPAPCESCGAKRDDPHALHCQLHPPILKAGAPIPKPLPCPCKGCAAGGECELTPHVLPSKPEGYSTDSYRGVPIHEPEEGEPSPPPGKMYLMHDGYQDFSKGGSGGTDFVPQDGPIIEDPLPPRREGVLTPVQETPPPATISINVPAGADEEIQAIAAGLTTMAKLDPAAKLRVAKYLLAYATAPTKVSSV